MTLTTERAEKLANYLNSDPERAKVLLEMDVEEALAKINADGNDFTTEELQSFAELMVKVSENNSGELDASELESVAGGINAPLMTKFCVAIGKAIANWKKH